MNDTKVDKNGFRKNILAAAVVIGACTLLFQGFTQAVMVVEAKETMTVPTRYAKAASIVSSSAQQSLPEGYRKANYTVRAIDREYFRNQTPTSKDMTREEAAEIGAQALWEIFGLNLEGQVIELGYQQPTEGSPRSCWHADVLVNGKLNSTFWVDSVTGELLTIGRERKLDKQVSVAFDAALDRNPQEYVELAKKMAEKYNVVHGAVKSVAYNSQGYSNNDPTISLDITGDNGEIALIDFSRYDKALLGIAYNGIYKPTLESIAKRIKQDMEKAAELQKSASPTNPNGEPTLKPVSEYFS
ncbi:hypothetical protein PAECIP111893_01695 [Paenibacillus plantiphilus]|uniref:FTP domain-containing protein n=1 Tax=Paenibacillus plantiphilus TaxID=2905650 RepID=A0ABN8GDB1_9BACL|nr:hypothetical protein [Paenibacillus plantiphilus]CAH1201680.1 hypothetical protein PAECIP111893_01695 [Paenibacillus plantiphilus]